MYKFSHLVKVVLYRNLVKLVDESVTVSGYILHVYVFRVLHYHDKTARVSTLKKRAFTCMRNSLSIFRWLGNAHFFLQ